MYGSETEMLSLGGAKSTERGLRVLCKIAYGKTRLPHPNRTSLNMRHLALSTEIYAKLNVVQLLPNRATTCLNLREAFEAKVLNHNIPLGYTGYYGNSKQLVTLEINIKGRIT